MNATLRLVRTEFKLLLREPLVLTFVFAFPIITVLVIAGSFNGNDRHDFAGIEPSQWYVASYLAVVIAAIGLVMVPVHLASYRERGVLQRFTAAGFPRWSFAIAQLTMGVVVTILAGTVLLVVAGLVYGIPPVDSPVSTVAAAVLGATAFTSLGLLLGCVLPNARAAQAVGLLLFFPSFLLGGGGPPPKAMDSAMRSVSDVLPFTHVAKAIRDPWLGFGGGALHLAAVGAVLVFSALAWRRAVRV
jgi:ABC-2 type transport system permease protein